MRLLIDTILVILSIKVLTVTSVDRCVSDDDWTFDCSSRGVTWSNLVDFNDNERASVDLNLASNDFYTEPQGSQIKNFSFNLFKQLNRRLNLSSNQFAHIESHAFYYIYQITDDISKIKFIDSDLEILSFTELDLSNNSFEIIPWNSLKSLPELTSLYLSSNPIKALDLGDLDKIDKSYFPSLYHIYLNASQIEYVNPKFFEFIQNLRTLDLSNNKIRYLEYTPSLSVGNFYIYNNPLECDCNLLWLKKYLEKKTSVSSYYKNMQHTCLVNTRSIEENSIIESKTIFINSTSLMVKNDQVDALRNNTRIETTVLSQVDEKKFYCDLKVDSNIENLSLSKQMTKTVKLDCTVETYPEPDIKWLLGQRDLDRDLKIFPNNYIINENRKLVNNLTYSMSSSLIVTLSGPIDQDTFSCRVFYKTDPKLNKNQVRPIYTQKSVLFNIISTSKEIRALNQTFSIMNSTVSAYLASIQSNGLKDQPFIYYIIFAILFLFCFFVILFVGVCLVRHKHAIKKEEQEYGYSGSDYSSINKRSTIYTGSNSLRGDSSTIVPLKPDVIREHQDYNSIYGQFFRTPSKHSNYLNTLMISPESINQNYNDDNESVYTNNNSIPIYHTSRSTQQSFDQNPVDTSAFEDTRSSSHLSSKTFEENTEEYLEPKFDDLRKPQKNSLKQSRI